MKENNISKTLKKLGFTENCIVEIILVTKNESNNYNAAPMGVIRKNNMFEVSPFKSSTTYRNLHKTKHASINITNDPMLFYKTAFKNQSKDTFHINDWIIEDSNASIMVEKKREVMFSNIRASITLNPIKIFINKKEPTVFSRGRAEAIEAVIHATRVNAFHSKKREIEVEELLKKIKNSFNVITRVSDKNSAEMKVVENLKNLFEKWGITY
jgi:hypothetical protein